MQFEELIMVSGKPGLYRVLSNSRVGMLVEELETGRRTNISSQSNMAPLIDIGLFTDDGQVLLREILMRMQTRRNELAVPDAKAGDEELKSYFVEIFPEHDRGRVYASVMRKVVRWFYMLDGKVEFEAKDEAENEPKDKSTEAATEE